MRFLQTQEKKKILILVPHQEVRDKLRKKREVMIQAGLKGVYDFPFAAPVAELYEPLTFEELKHTAHSIRKFTKGEKFLASEDAELAFPSGEDTSLSGVRLNFEIPASAFGVCASKIKNFFSPLIISSFIMPKTIEQQIIGFAPEEKLSFRAAAVANMYWHPFQADGETAYKWKIEKLIWLPVKIKNYNSQYNQSE